MPSFKQRYNRALGIIVPACGEEIEYRPRAKPGVRYKLKAVYDDEYEAVDPETNQIISSNSPRIGVRYSDLISPPQKDDEVYILGETFKVYDSQEDGQGGVTIYLHRLETDESYERKT